MIVQKDRETASSDINGNISLSHLEGTIVHWLTAFVFLLVTVLASADDPSLPFSKRIITGQLDNGLTYFIQANDEPANRAELRLLVKAGSLLEQDFERGVAHFIEHLAFNGTKHFAGDESKEFMESLGMSRGKDINAETNFNYTLYKLTVPTKKKRILSKAILLLADWAAEVNFDSATIDDERSVIFEEERARRGVGKRVSEKIQTELWKGSRYLERQPIGDVDVIKNLSSETLQGYYHRWYTPDRMALIAVGDFDPELIKRYIKKRFRKIPAASPASAPSFSIPAVNQLRVVHIDDPEQRSNSVGLNFIREPQVLLSESQLKQLFQERLAISMLGDRLSERGFETEPPFLRAGAGYSKRVDQSRTFNLSATVEDDGFSKGLEALQTELLRAVQYGFSEAELDRHKERSMTFYKRVAEEQDKMSHGLVVANVVRKFLYDDPLVDPDQWLELASRIFPRISLGNVNQALSDLVETQRQVVLYVTSTDNVVRLPNTEQTTEILGSVDPTSVSPYQEQISTKPWLSKIPAAGEIVSEKHDAQWDITEWMLGNGVKVIVKPTRFRENEVLLRAFRTGGYSNAEDEDYISAVQSWWLVNRTGFGGFDIIEMNKRLAGKTTRINSRIDRYTDRLSGSTTWDEVEEMLQLSYLMFTSPSVDDAAVLANQRFLRQQREKRNLDVSSRFADEVTKLKFNDHLRMRPWQESQIDEVDGEKALQSYRDSFGNVAGFTFVFVGNIDVEEFKRHVKTYIASLPADSKQGRTWVDRGIRVVPGEHTIIRDYSNEPRVRVGITLRGASNGWIPEEFHFIRVVQGLLSKRLTETLRDDEQKVYSVRASIRHVKYPSPQIETAISFYSQVGNEQDLIKTVRAVIEDVRLSGFSEEERTYITDKEIRNFETAIRNNGAWLASLSRYAELDIGYAWITHFERNARAVSLADLALAAKRFLQADSYFETILLPQKEEEDLDLQFTGDVADDQE